MEQSTAEQRSDGADQQAEKPWLVPYRWPKGYCPNPSGRPKGSHTVGGALKQILDSDEGQDAAAIALNLVRMAKSEDPDVAGPALSAIKEVFERTDGKVEKSIKQTGEPTVVVINGPRVAKPSSPP